MVVLSRVTVSLEDELDEEERLALAEQAMADRLQAQADEMAAHARERLRAVILARAALAGEHPPVVERHDEPGCRESIPLW
ncbi:MAG TPA: hypothetical protein PKA95_02000 [Thermomicrobiales bacterium]|nr:hypothetical protein [Thermomicrobiales bacterium]